MAEVILNNDNFKAEVLDAKGLVLVDFWATWCGPCKMLAPTVSEIADEYEGKVKVCKLDVDQAMDIAMSYGVASIPTLILFKDGESVKKSVGVVSKTERQCGARTIQIQILNLISCPLMMVQNRQYMICFVPFLLKLIIFYL